MSRRIRLVHVNAALYLLIAALVFFYWEPLRWARHELPGYLNGEIGALIERRFYLRAYRNLERGQNLERTRTLLERSLAIDPNGEALYWRAELHERLGEEEAALRDFEAYLKIDPTPLNAYLKSASLLERLGRTEEAREVLERGLAYFSVNVERYAPHYEPYADPSYNRKAALAHHHYRSSATALQREIERLDAASAEPTAARPVAP